MINLAPIRRQYQQHHEQSNNEKGEATSLVASSLSKKETILEALDPITQNIITTITSMIKIGEKKDGVDDEDDSSIVLRHYHNHHQLFHWSSIRNYLRRHFQYHQYHNQKWCKCKRVSLSSHDDDDVTSTPSTTSPASSVPVSLFRESSNRLIAPTAADAGAPPKSSNDERFDILPPTSKTSHHHHHHRHHHHHYNSNKTTKTISEYKNNNNSLYNIENLDTYSSLTQTRAISPASAADDAADDIASSPKSSSLLLLLLPSSTTSILQIHCQQQHEHQDKSKLISTVIKQQQFHNHHHQCPLLMQCHLMTTFLLFVLFFFFFFFHQAKRLICSLLMTIITTTTTLMFNKNSHHYHYHQQNMFLNDNNNNNSNNAVHLNGINNTTKRSKVIITKIRTIQTYIRCKKSLISLLSSLLFFLLMIMMMMVSIGLCRVQSHQSSSSSLCISSYNCHHNRQQKHQHHSSNNNYNTQQQQQLLLLLKKHVNRRSTDFGLNLHRHHHPSHPHYHGHKQHQQQQLQNHNYSHQHHARPYNQFYAMTAASQSSVRYMQSEQPFGLRHNRALTGTDSGPGTTTSNDDNNNNNGDEDDDNNYDDNGRGNYNYTTTTKTPDRSVRRISTEEYHHGSESRSNVFRQPTKYNSLYSNPFSGSSHYDDDNDDDVHYQQPLLTRTHQQYSTQSNHDQRNTLPNLHLALQKNQPHSTISNHYHHNHLNYLSHSKMMVTGDIFYDQQQRRSCPPGPQLEDQLDVATKAYLAPVVFYGQLISLGDDYKDRFAATFRLIQLRKPLAMVGSGSVTLNNSTIRSGFISSSSSLSFLSELLSPSVDIEKHIKLYFRNHTTGIDKEYCAMYMPNIKERLILKEKYILFAHEQIISTRYISVPSISSKSSFSNKSNPNNNNHQNQHQHQHHLQSYQLQSKSSSNHHSSFSSASSYYKNQTSYNNHHQQQHHATPVGHQQIALVTYALPEIWNRTNRRLVRKIVCKGCGELYSNLIYSNHNRENILIVTINYC